MGIMPDKLNVPAIPGFFSKLGIYVRIHVRTDATTTGIRVRLMLPDGTEKHLETFSETYVQTELTKALAQGRPYIGFLIQSTATMLPLTRTGRLNLMVDIGGEEILAASLEVATQAKTSTVSAQPSAQSPPVAPKS
jgi:hypothetical protein